MSQGTLQVSGTSSQLVTGRLNCGGGGSGSMDVRDSGVVTVEDGNLIIVGNQCVAGGDGTYIGNTDIEDGGVLEPGAPLGDVHIGGNLTVFGGGLVRLEVTGTNAVTEQDSITADDSINFQDNSTCEIILDESRVSLDDLAVLILFNASSAGDTANVRVVDTSGNTIKTVPNADMSNGGAGALAGGTAVDDLCPCESPADGTSWKNHGKSVSCVAHAAGDLVKLGELDPSEIGGIVSVAAQSNCGK